MISTKMNTFHISIEKFHTFILDIANKILNRVWRIHTICRHRYRVFNIFSVMRHHHLTSQFHEYFLIQFS